MEQSEFQQKLAALNELGTGDSDAPIHPQLVSLLNLFQSHYEDMRNMNQQLLAMTTHMMNIGAPITQTVSDDTQVDDIDHAMQGGELFGETPSDQDEG